RCRTSSRESQVCRRASRPRAESSSRSCRRPSAPPAWPCPSLPVVSCLACQLVPVLFSKAGTYLAPSFLLFPAPFAACTGFLGAKVKLLNVPGMHQTVASVVHDDAADLQHIAVMRGLKRHLGILLDQQDRHALLFIDAADDLENFLDQDRRQPKRGLVQEQ